MPARKLRLEVFDSQGNRYVLTCEGSVNKENALRLFDLVELVGGPENENPKWRRTSLLDSKFAKVSAVIENHFSVEWFSSQDARRVCEQELGEHLSLSTVSTYLSRLADRGFLMRKGSPSQRKYKVLIAALNDKQDIAKGE